MPIFLRFQWRRSRKSDWSFGVGQTHLDTRIEGIAATWSALRFACESSDLGTIVTTLKAANIKLLHKSLQMCYDKDSYRYDVPIFMINDPSSFEEKKAEEVVESKDLNVAFILASLFCARSKTTK